MGVVLYAPALALNAGRTSIFFKYLTTTLSNHFYINRCQRLLMDGIECSTSCSSVTCVPVLVILLSDHLQ